MVEEVNGKYLFLRSSFLGGQLSELLRIPQHQVHVSVEGHKSASRTVDRSGMRGPLSTLKTHHASKRIKGIPYLPTM